MKKILHVNQHNIKFNRKPENKDHMKPVLTVKTYKGGEMGMTAIVRTKDGVEVGRFVYQPHKTLPCGANCWWECDTDVVDVEVIGGWNDLWGC